MERSPNRNSTCSNIYIGVALSEREELNARLGVVLAVSRTPFPPTDHHGYWIGTDEPSNQPALPQGGAAVAPLSKHCWHVSICLASTLPVFDEVDDVHPQDVAPREHLPRVEQSELVPLSNLDEFARRLTESATFQVT